MSTWAGSGVGTETGATTGAGAGTGAETGRRGTWTAPAPTVEHTGYLAEFVTALVPAFVPNIVPPSVPAPVSTLVPAPRSAPVPLPTPIPGPVCVLNFVCSPAPVPAWPDVTLSCGMTDNPSIDGKLATADELYSVTPQPRVMSVKAGTGTGDLTKVGTRTGTGIGVGLGTGVEQGAGTRVAAGAGTEGGTVSVT